MSHTPDDTTRPIVEEALQFANSSFERHLRAHEAHLKSSDFTKLAVENVDYNTPEKPYSAKRMLARVRYATNDLARHLREADGPDAVYRACLGFSEHELHRLFFETNDPIAARIKRDYLSGFITAYITEMRGFGKLNPKDEVLLREVLDGFNHGLSSYDALRQEIMEKTDGDVGGLRYLAQIRQREMHKRVFTESELAQGSQEMLRKIYQHYGVGTNGLPSPHMMLALRKVVLIVKEQMLAQNPHLDWDQVKDEQAEEVYGRAAGMLQMVAEQYSDTLSYSKMLGLDEVLNAALWKARGLPEDFDGCLQSAVEVATKHAQSTIGESYRQFHGEQHGYIEDNEGKKIAARPRSAKLQEQIFPALDKHESSQQYIAWRLDQLNQALAGATSKKEVIDNIEWTTESLINDVQFSMKPPALLLVVRNHIDQFRKTLVEQLRARGVYDEEFMKRLHEEVERFDLAYESALIARGWLFEATKGDHDHYMFKAFVDLLPAHPRAGDEQDDRHAAKVQDRAVAVFEEVVCARGIPKALAQEPMAPVLYARCLEAASNELANQSNPMMQGMRLKAMHPLERTHALRKQRPMSPDAPEMTERCKERALELLRGAVAHMPVDNDYEQTMNRKTLRELVDASCGLDEEYPQQQPEEPWDQTRRFSAEGLHMALDYIDHTVRRARSH